MLNGYDYYTGIVFSGYTYGTGDAIVKGGRYDNLTRQFGKDIAAIGFGALAVQGIATSIDALSVGFTIADYRGALAFSAALMIGAVTFLICYAGLKIGRRAGMKLAGKATVLGGLLLIGIGIEIFISHHLK